MKPVLILLALIAAWPADACPRHRDRPGGVRVGEYSVLALACDPVSGRCVRAWRHFISPIWR